MLQSGTRNGFVCVVVSAWFMNFFLSSLARPQIICISVAVTFYSLLPTASSTWFCWHWKAPQKEHLGSVPGTFGLLYGRHVLIGPLDKSQFSTIELAGLEVKNCRKKVSAILFICSVLSFRHSRESVFQTGLTFQEVELSNTTVVFRILLRSMGSDHFVIQSSRISCQVTEFLISDRDTTQKCRFWLTKELQCVWKQKYFESHEYCDNCSPTRWATIFAWQIVANCKLPLKFLISPTIFAVK